ncbi:unnamed protein product, partial [Staurois parvus]
NSHLPVPRSHGVLPAAHFTSHLVFLEPASSVWAPGCDSLQLHSQLPSCEKLCLNGPLVFWDLSRVPEDYGEGSTTSASDRLGDRSGSGSGYLSNSGTRSPKVPILIGGSGGPVFKVELPLLGGAPL